ncbi:hypothetical protein C8J57DRAFT_1480634 [Mycena rebaudengoi]|nr:hypothetical protein C8J57DRAFT_1480634 [Mycena rebaudengoi]
MDTKMWEDVQTILRRLAERGATAVATCGSLVALLCDSDVPQIIDGALWVLSRASRITFPPVTTEVSVEAMLLDRLAYMLKDSSTPERHYLRIFAIISDLASNESTAIAVVEANTLNTMEKLLRSCPTNPYEDIFPILENLASHKSTAIAVVRMLPLDLLGTLWRKSFEDRSPIDVLAIRLEVLVTKKLLSARHKATAEATSSSFVAIFCDSDIPQVVDGTLWLLSHAPHIKFPPVTTGVSMEAKLLDHIVDMLKAPNMVKWRYPVIFQLLSHLALHESGAVAIVEANVLDSVEKLLKSRPTDLYEHIFPMLKSLASHESTVAAVLNMRLYDLLATLWHDGLTLPVIDLLACMARWQDGAEGVVATTALDNALDGLYSLRPQIRSSTCRLLQELVRHESTVQAVITAVRRGDIVALLIDWNYFVREGAVATLQILDATVERIIGSSPAQGSITQDAGRTATGRPFCGTSGCNLVGPDHKPKAQVYGRRVPPPRQNSPVSTSQQKAVACLPFAECMRDHRSACSTSEEGSQPTIKPVSWPEKGVNGAGKTECGVPRTRRSALRELAMTEIETTCEIFVLSRPDGPTSAGKNGLPGICQYGLCMGAKYCGERRQRSQSPPTPHKVQILKSLNKYS